MSFFATNENCKCQLDTIFMLGSHSPLFTNENRLLTFADGNVTDLEGSQPEINMDYEDDDDDDNVILDSAPTDNEDLTFSSPIQHPQSGQQEAPLGMDEQLVTAFEPGEYSYFKPSAISTWEGPNHWKMKLHSKVPSAGIVLTHIQ